MKITKLFLSTAILTIIPSQLIRVPLLGSGAITLSDVFVLLTLIAFIFELSASTKKLIYPKTIITFAQFFSICALVSTFFAFNFYSPTQLLEGSFLFLRFMLYFSLLIITYNVYEPKKDKVLNLFFLTGFFFALMGFLQYILFPDLSGYVEYGWDPHIYRLFSSTLDPNFTGGILSVFFAFSFAGYIFEKKSIFLVLSTVFAIAIILTFSRSSYLALIVVLSIIGLQKSRKIALITLTTFLILLFLVPQTRSRVIGALTIDDTANARIESWQKAVKIFIKNPIFGVGFNNYRLVQEKEGLFSYQNPYGGHSGAGSDSSLLTVAATTGILGFSFFLLFNIAIIRVLHKNSTKNFISLASFSAFLGIILHSQFVNSFFYPQMMLVMWFFIGLKLKNDD